MLRYFRINDPYRLVALLVLLVIVYLPLFIDLPQITSRELKAILVGEKIHDGSQMYAEVTDNTAPLAAWFHALMDMLFDRSLLARHIVAFILVFLQSAYLGIIFITKKVFNENTFIPSLLFSVLFLFSFDTISLTDELLGSTFLLFALNNLFKEIEFRTAGDETTFNLGLYISFASLFYFPYLTFLVGVLVSLFLFARANPRKYLLLIFGFVLPHLFVLSLSYLNGSFREIWSFYYSANLAFGADFLVSAKSLITLAMIPVFYLIISIVMLNRLARFSKYQSQTLQCIFLWLGFCFIYFLFCKELTPQTLIVLIPPVTFLLTHFLLLIRRKRYGEMNLLILFFGVILTSYLARYDLLRGVSYKKLIVDTSAIKKLPEGTQVLVLENQPGYYVDHQSATPFINWELSRAVFEHPEYYQSVTAIYDGFEKSQPDIIVDKDNLMKPFFDRIPELKEIYKREGSLYVKKPSN